MYWREAIHQSVAELSLVPPGHDFGIPGEGLMRIFHSDEVCRRRDPLNCLGEVGAKIGQLYEPSITNDDVELRLDEQDILDLLPAYDDRRAILARDSLASVEGFKLSILITCEYLFGMRVCIDCPNCNHGRQAVQAAAQMQTPAPAVHRRRRDADCDRRRR